MGKINKTTVWIIMALSFACGTVFVLGAAEIFSFFMDNSSSWKGIAWIFFLIGSVIAAFRAKKYQEKNTSAETLFGAQIRLSLLGGFSAAIIYFFMVVRNSFILYGEVISAGIFFVFFSLGVIFLVGFLFGKLLGSLDKIKKEKMFSREKAALCQGLGFLLGAAVFYFSFILSLNEMALVLIAGLINILLAIFGLFFFFGKKKIFGAKFNSAIFLLVFFIFSFQSSGEWEQHFLKKYYYYQEFGKNLRGVFSSTDEYLEIKRQRAAGKISDLVKAKNPSISDWLIKAYSRKLEEYPDFPQNYGIFLNGREYYSTNYDDISTDYLVHLPVMLSGKIPEKVLVVGDFSGAAARELEKYSGIKEIVLVGLGRKDFDFAKDDEILRKANRDSLADKRIRLVTQDVFDFFAKTEEKFDAVFLSIPQSSDSEFSRFFSKKFFTSLLEKMEVSGFCAAILADDGNSIKEARNELEAAGARSITQYQSNLESGNGNAVLLLSNMLEKGMILKGESTEKISDKDRAIQDILRENASKVRNNFVYFRKIPGKNNITYQDYGIKYTLLDEDRFYAAFILEAPETSSKNLLKLKIPETSF